MTTLARADIYALIHKGIRAALADTLRMAGQLDWTDDEALARTLEQVRELTALCHGHLEHENRFVHPAMEARRPGSTRRTAMDHLQHRRDIARLEELAMTLEHLPASRREPMARALYAALAMFTAENLEHMAVEETENNPVLWATHSDAEINAITRALVASMSPDEHRRCLRWMLPHATPAERAGLLADMRANAPAEAFADTLALIEPLLAPADLAKLRGALGIARPLHDYIGTA